MKSSSRAGRFKKKLVSENQLIQEAPQIEERIAPYLDLYSQGKITDYELTAIFILVSLALRYPGTWLGSKRPSLAITHSLNAPLPQLNFEPNIQKRLVGIESVGELFGQFAFKSTPEIVNRSILSWSSGHYPLELMFRIPSPSEVLDQQKMGRRCVTVLTSKQRISHYILGERDYLSFTMHDLIHADHFYFHNHCYTGQLGFYGLLDYSIKQGYFNELLKNSAFKNEFEYFISDMNAYAIHLLKCLKSAMNFYESKVDFFKKWIEELNPSDLVKASLFQLNQLGYSPEVQDPLILKWLDSWRYKEIPEDPV